MNKRLKLRKYLDQISDLVELAKTENDLDLLLDLLDSIRSDLAKADALAEILSEEKGTS